MKYDYRKKIKEDIKKYIKDNNVVNFDYEELYEELFIADSVTGNASGSYTFNTLDAEENLTHNMDLLKEACEMFGDTLDNAINKGAEYCDVTIRCYLLGEMLSKVIEEERG